MQTEALTARDREWLSQHADACRLKCEFIMQDTLRRGSSAAAQAARNVPIWLDGGYTKAAEIEQQIQRETPYSQIFEQWEERNYQSILACAKKISAHEGRALIVAAGFGEACGAALCSAAYDALVEAHDGMYGDEQ